VQRKRGDPATKRGFPELGSGEECLCASRYILYPLGLVCWACSDEVLLR
jgi:hypothetical protein